MSPVADARQEPESFDYAEEDLEAVTLSSEKIQAASASFSGTRAAAVSALLQRLGTERAVRWAEKKAPRTSCRTCRAR